MEQQHQQSQLTKAESPKLNSKPLCSEEDELEELQSKRTIYDKAYGLAEKLACNSLGQYVLSRSDRVLKMVEDTAKWSLPQDKNDVKLERPCAWIPFLCMIVVLRFTRTYMTIVAKIIGNRSVTPQDMISFIQSRRRKLRAIRMHGLKEMGRREMEANALKSGAADNSFVGKMRTLLSRAICRPGQLTNEPARRIFVHQSKNNTSIYGDKENNDRTTTKRPRDEENAPELNLTLEQMLNKYENENSDDDSDYVPHIDEEESNDESTSSNASSSSSAADIDEEEEDDESAKKKAEDDKTMEKADKGDKNVWINYGELKMNGVGMPKPIVEVKKEPLSSVLENGGSTSSNSVNNTAGSKAIKSNGPLNGDVADIGNGY